MSAFKWIAGPTYHYNRFITFYAMNGSICISDDSPNCQPRDRFRVVSIKDFLHRAEALGQGAKKMGQVQAENPRRSFAEDRDHQLRIVERMVACCQDAKNQGDPLDPEVAKWRRRHAPPRPVVNPGTQVISAAPGPLPRGNFTGRTAKPDFSVPAPPSKSKLILQE